MNRRALAFVIVVASHMSTADAEPRVAGGLDYTVARGSRIDHFDLGLRLEAGLFLAVGPWHATGSFSGLMKVESDLPSRDGDSLSGIGVGGRLAYHHRFARRGVIMVALGFERVWLNGGEEVRRGCRETGACLIGYFTETPDYDAWAPQLRVGLGQFIDDPKMLLGLTFELIVEPMYFRDIPPDGAGGVAVFAAITATIGGGGKGTF